MTTLICTVGGSHQPIEKAIKSIQPDHVLFVCSQDDAETANKGSYTENLLQAQRIYTAAQSVEVNFIEPLFLTVKQDGGSAWVHIDDRGF